MPVNSATEYGLRLMIQLSDAWPAGHIPASVISEKEGLTVQYVSKLLHHLRKNGLVDAVRGQSGGFRLSKAPSEISVQEIVHVLDPERYSKTFCSKYTGNESECVHVNSDCRVKPLWGFIVGYFSTVMGEITLADLAGPTAESYTRVRNVMKEFEVNLTDKNQLNGGQFQ